MEERTMADKKNILTYAGLKRLEDELHDLKVVKRKEVAQKIKEAREQGDLSENAEYDAAKDEQAMIEAEIKKMEDLLLTAIIIKKEEVDCSKVNVGTIVKVYDEEFDEEVEYKIVGTQESDPKNFIISNESPLGAGLLGHKVGEFVTVSTPNGDSRYKILSIRV